MSNKIYEIVTERIMKMLEKGEIPWKKPWADIPKVNYVFRRPYRGINVFLLPKGGEYLTWNQIQKLGGKVKKGSSSHMVVFYKTYTKNVTKEEEDSETGEIKEVQDEVTIPLLRYYRVFHIDDVEGVETKFKLNKEHNPVEEAEEIINNTTFAERKIVTNLDETIIISK